MNKKRIIWVSNSPLMVTGYARITREVCSRLSKKGYDIYVVADTYNGQPQEMDGYMLLPRRPNGQDILWNYIKQYEPEFAVFLDDTFTLVNQKIHTLPWHTVETKMALYYPQDGYGVPQLGIPVIQIADHHIAMSHFSNYVVERELEITSDIVWHGYDTNIFNPCDEATKNEIRKKYNIPEDAIVYSYIGRNSARKLNQLLLHTMVKFLKDHPKAYLFAHINDAKNPTNDLDDFIKRGIPSREGDKYNDVIQSDRLILDGRSSSLSKGLTDAEMAEIYQMSDAYVSASSGEGFGLPLLEAMACGIPVIATNYTTTEELILSGEPGPRGFGVKPLAVWTGSFNVDHAIWDMDDALEKLDIIYNDKDAREEMGLNALTFAKDNFNWDTIIDEWIVSLNGAKKMAQDENRRLPITREEILFFDKDSRKYILFANGNKCQAIDINVPIAKNLIKRFNVTSSPCLVNIKTGTIISDEAELEAHLLNQHGIN